MTKKQNNEWEGVASRDRANQMAASGPELLVDRVKHWN